MFKELNGLAPPYHFKLVSDGIRRRWSVVTFTCVVPGKNTLLGNRSFATARVLTRVFDWGCGASDFAFRRRAVNKFTLFIYLLLLLFLLLLTETVVNEMFNNYIWLMMKETVLTKRSISIIHEVVDIDNSYNYRKAELSQRWPPHRVMRPMYGCPENFRESLNMPTATFPEIFNGLFFRLMLWICVQSS